MPWSDCTWAQFDNHGLHCSPTESIDIVEYSRTSLSRTRLFRITAYLEVKIWSLFKHETMTTGNKIMWKGGEIAPQEQFFFSFPHYYIYIFLTSWVKLHIHLLNVVVQFIVFLTLSSLICRSTDISKCFSESLGIRDNGSRLYINLKQKWQLRSCPGRATINIVH